jgi:DNA-directed RNA polymerase III subunit RPC7
MPQELRPSSKRKVSTAKPIIKEKKPKPNVDIDTKLNILEQRENQLPVEEEETDKKKDSDDDEEKEGEDEKMMDSDLEDDYGNNYFDNGEGFDSEDGDDGEGPTY